MLPKFLFKNGITFRRNKISLKNKLLLYFIIVSFLISVVVSTYYYIDSKRAFENATVQNNNRVIQQIMDNIDQNIQQADQFFRWVGLDTYLNQLLNRSRAEVTRFDHSNMNAITNIGKQFAYLPVAKYISAFFVIGANGLDIRNGNDAYLIDRNRIAAAQWYREAMKKDGQVVWGVRMKNLIGLSDYKYIIPAARLIISPINGKVLGMNVLLFKEDFISRCIDESLLNSCQGENIYLFDAAGVVNYSSNNDYSFPEDLARNIVINQTAPVFVKINQQKYLVSFTKSSLNNWYLVLAVPTRNVLKGQTAIMGTTICLIIVAMSISLAVSNYLSKSFTKPIKKLIIQVEEIATGNFTQHKKVVAGDSELNYLADSIFKMSTDLNALFNEVKIKEAQKRKSELKLLQRQINPHFLYNTLNSIKWLALMQKATGISEIASRLGRLLKRTLSGETEKIPIKEELSILEDYLYIQKIRYKSKVTFNIRMEDEALADYLIVKFTLQPLVENAIFHGVEPKDGTGIVEIAFSQDAENRIMVEIFDNGRGMDAATLDRLKRDLDLMPETSIEGGKIGIINVAKRIRMIYGNEYGVAIDSKLNEYTKVTIRFPAEKAAEAGITQGSEDVEDIDCRR